MKSNILTLINNAISAYFAKYPKLEKVRAKDLMPFFISQNVFEKDDSKGKPIRAILRELDKNKQLHLIPSVFAERKTVNTEWYFIQPNTVTHIKNINSYFKTDRPKPFLKDNLFKESFAPIIDQNTEVLILGSLPGDISLSRNEYYANKTNQFWKIMEHILGTLPYEYEGRCSLLLKNKIGLWDVFKNAEREGSLDTNIKHGQPNDFKTLLLNYPNIRAVCFNGKKAFDEFSRHNNIDNKYKLIILPSSSSARTISFFDKCKEWIQIKNNLN